MTETGASPHRSSSLDHILLDYPITNEETLSKRYTFFYDLGSGAYATVKYGTCAKTNKPYAIKIISKAKTPKDYLKKFVPREVDALKRLSIHKHPFVSQMREFFETPQRVYLVTKLAQGGDLLTYINSRKYLNEDISKRMIAELLCAVNHIHDLGVVHRDLKCENLLIGPEDCIMVSDFGFATQQPKNRLLTTFCGSYAYAAPEILSGSSYNGKCTDTWSVGVVLYAMLNGKLPYNDTKPKNILAKIKSGPLVMSKRVSVACEKFVRSILTINSMERPKIADLLTKKWLENPIQRILKILPEKVHPSCFKLSLPQKSSFRMSDSSEDCIKVFSPRQIVESQQTPLTITNEFIAHASSHKTSSTISERMKKKYKQIKTDIRTWASRKRKSVGVVDQHLEFAEIDGTPTENESPTMSINVEKLIDIDNSPKTWTNKGDHPSIKLKYAIHGKDNLASSNRVIDISKDHAGRSFSAVPPVTAPRRSSIESRAKSCKQNHDPIGVKQAHNPDSASIKRANIPVSVKHPHTQVNVNPAIMNNPVSVNHTAQHTNKKTRRSSQNSGKINDVPTKKMKSAAKRENGKGPENLKAKDGAINAQILQYLTNQRENNKSAKPCRSPLGLPPLHKNSQEKIRSKCKSSSSSRNTSAKDWKTNDVDVKRKTTYDKAILYHNIQNISNKFDTSSHIKRGSNPLTQTKVVEVDPHIRRSSYDKKARKGSLEKKAIAGIHELSTIYTH